MGLLSVVKGPVSRGARSPGNRAREVSELDISSVTWLPVPPTPPGEERHVNCFQKTLGAFASRMGIPAEKALDLGTYFGGGMRCGGTCGPVNAGLMVLGYYFGGDPAYAELGREFLEAFGAANGSWLCADIKDEEKIRCERAIQWAIDWVEAKLATK